MAADNEVAVFDLLGIPEYVKSICFQQRGRGKNPVMIDPTSDPDVLTTMTPVRRDAIMTIAEMIGIADAI